MNKKLLSMLSICQKAGKIVSGEFAVEKALQDGSALYVIIANNVSENTKKKFENKSFYYKVDYVIYGEKEVLSHSIGKVNRAVFAILDEGFCNKIKQYIENDIK
ncbi:ribosomal L7Ae/L30e/S12e/Gadd45 family protein [uncultured Tyzzerella sp.]|uniref:L7Ae/L30e/S12e/Gadd45 family ribosomal protein n=1 Tax=uncultured Tyzzerella sp. TaxID=2321398 RepID=UPI002941EE90|nr:ribosomal L7Ae/L30e/S12e/Gadd45 family protein [uncultured Tyzzerella sp.]